MDIFEENLQRACRLGLFEWLAGHYYFFLKRLDPKADRLVWITGAFAVHLCQGGHSCLALSNYSQKKILTEIGLELGENDAVDEFPEIEEWRAILSHSKLVGRPGDCLPFVIDQGGRLYLLRYWQYETRLAEELSRRTLLNGFSSQKIVKPLAQLFPGTSGEQVDCQMIAAATAALRKLCIVSGGPGAGKTFTVFKIIVLLQMLAEPSSLRVGLAAPTGKAARRLQESLNNSQGQLGISPDFISSLSLEAKTIHRLLGPRPHSPYFRYHKGNKLQLDLLVVDEVSMVDLALMVKMVEALPDECVIVMLGDKDQLSSVEAGRVMADLCYDVYENRFSRVLAAQLSECGFPIKNLPVDDGLSSLKDCIVLLTKSYRFSGKSSIARLASAVLAGEHDLALQCFREQKNVCIKETFTGEHDISSEYLQRIQDGYGEFLQCDDPALAFKAIGKFQVLCAHRRGRFGVEGLNAMIEKGLSACRLIRNETFWYRGRPVMVTGNHYNLGLFNGDLGITLLDENGQLRIYFSTPAGLRSISPSRMPEHQTAFALTVHKSQGSEYDHVVLVLPEMASRVVSRELIYTAITRSKKSFSLWGDAAIFEKGLKRKMERESGLSDIFTGMSVNVG